LRSDTHCAHGSPLREGALGIGNRSFENSPTTSWDDCGLMAIERAGLSSYLDFRQGYSAVELPKLVEAERLVGAYSENGPVGGAI
jgi:hypothetical protein